MSDGWMVEARCPEDRRAAMVWEVVLNHALRGHAALEECSRRIDEALERHACLWGVPWRALNPTPVAGDGQGVLPDDTMEVLVDFAREGRRQDFCDLAGCAGVAPGRYDELWAGTRRRLGLEP